MTWTKKLSWAKKQVSDAFPRCRKRIRTTLFTYARSFESTVSKRLVDAVKRDNAF